jgi:hypothetical protein
MGEGLDFCDEEPLASMWPPDIEDKSNKQFNIEKPSLTENLLKEFQSKEEKHKLDFNKLKELTDYSDIGSHQLTSLAKQYKFRRVNAARLLNEELDLLSKQRQEIEQRKQEILRVFFLFVFLLLCSVWFKLMKKFYLLISLYFFALIFLLVHRGALAVCLFYSYEESTKPRNV